jgi:hypothetical protein
MIFTVQRYLEDYFERRRLEDADQYAVKVANAFAKAKRGELSKGIARIRTVFFRSNSGLVRREFEDQLVELLVAKFKKKSFDGIDEFPGGVSDERRRIARAARREIGSVLAEFKRATEARAVDAFWLSRASQQLVRRPETIGQALLGMFLQGVVLSGGFSTREIGSGTGYVDILVFFSSTPHLVELKVLKNRFQGPSQLNEYMRHEKRHVGWLVVFDARGSGSGLPTSVNVSAGVVNILRIDINPVAPSRVK